MVILGWFMNVDYWIFGCSTLIFNKKRMLPLLQMFGKGTCFACFNAWYATGLTQVWRSFTVKVTPAVRGDHRYACLITILQSKVMQWNGHGWYTHVHICILNIYNVCHICIVYISICNGTHKYCTKQTTFQWHWSVISWGDPWETRANRNPKSTPRDLCIHRDRFSHWSDSMHFRDRTRSNRQKHFHRAASNLCLSTTTETLQMCGFPFAYNLHCLCWRRRAIGYSSTSQNAFECLYHCSMPAFRSFAGGQRVKFWNCFRVDSSEGIAWKLGNSELILPI